MTAVAPLGRTGRGPDLLAVAVGVGATVGYWLAVDPVVHAPAQVAYPLGWLVVSGVALRSLVLPRVRSLSTTGAVVGGGYALLLLWTAGLVGPATGRPTVAVHLGTPGWGPAVAYTGPVVSMLVIPFLTVGYLTLGLLAGIAVDDRRRGVVPGVVGLFACVGCTAPLLAGLAGAIGAGAVGASLARSQYPLATAAFLLAVAVFALLLRSAPGPGPSADHGVDRSYELGRMERHLPGATVGPDGMADSADGEYAFVCPECAESLTVNASMREALVEKGCVVCGAAVTAAAFGPAEGDED